LINIYNFLQADSVQNLLLSGLHTAPIMSLHYLVEHKYLKTNNIILQTSQSILSAGIPYVLNRFWCN